jgi:phenylacetate-CoA ligase
MSDLPGQPPHDGPPADFSGLHIALVGPLPPPSGGIANQTLLLADLLREAGAVVELVRVNPPHPRWVARVRGTRALVRLPVYLWRLWRAAGRAQLLHVMANSGWSWHLHAAPAIWIGRLRGIGVVVNYRGGEAPAFMRRRGGVVAFSLRHAQALIVPSQFLGDLFQQYGLQACIVPNVLDFARFHPRPQAAVGGAAILVARHLEAVYDNASAIRALALLRQSLPHASLTLCGAGPEHGRLHQLAAELGVAGAVHFAGTTTHAQMAQLYRQADVLLNPSRADNLPNSVLEAWASGVPVVSTAVGGISYLVDNGASGLLVAPGDHAAMAAAMLALLTDRVAASRLAAKGQAEAQRHRWPNVAPLLRAQYRRVLMRPPASGYTAWVARCLFPLHERLKRHHSHRLRLALERSQWWSPSDIQALQLQRLQALLRHAGEQVPYYRQLFARLAFDPLQVQDVADLRRLPILRKADINDHRDAFRAAGAGALQRLTTGGSSGEPLIFYVGKDRVSHDVAAKWRATRWWGVDIGDREAVMWGSPIELQAQDAWRARRDRLLRTRLLPAFDLSPSRLDSYLASLRHQQPRMLFGYPSVLCVLARHAQQRQCRLDDLGIKVVFVTAERLYDDQRALLSRVFGAPVANGYGGRDAGFIAHECPEGGLHICAEDIIVEIVDHHGAPVPAGERGAIVVTHLASADFPFIRYATGDVGALDPRPCPCGRGLPLLKAVEGRATDFVVARDGTVMHGLALIYILRDVAQIRAFKIIQESLDRIRVLIVATPGLPAAVQASIVAQFHVRLGAGVDIVLEPVAAIPAEASGKHRYVISHVAHHS